MEKIVIIGAGHGGVQVASSLRSEGFLGSIHLIAREPEFPYQKPPLSKDFLKGKIGEANLAFRSAGFYQKNNIDLELGVDVQEIDIKNQRVIAKSGKEHLFDQLILATGADNRILQIEGSHLDGIHYLRTLADAQTIKAKLAAAQKIAVVGGGFIGLELAAAAVVQGKDVTVIEAQDRLMARVLPPLLTDVFQQEHEANGVKFHFSAFASSFEEKNGQATGVRLKSGSLIEADLILVGIGVVPNTSLAETANLDCDNGIVVNEFMQTSSPGIFSVGDCANHYNHFAGKRTRLESVQNAVDQAKTVAKFITGNAEPYHAVPWFWTNQYQLKLQMAGFNTGFDEYVVRGNLDDKKFSICYYKDQKLIGADSLNKPSDHLGVRKLIQAGVSPDKDSIVDTTIKIKSLLPQ
jgi:3-phenylpropionate/trans-cinnamate dioxygenase ferredoxin reductase subunit